MSNRKDHGLKEHGLSDDAVEAGHDFIHEAEIEEERVSVLVSSPHTILFANASIMTET